MDMNNNTSSATRLKGTNRLAERLDNWLTCHSVTESFLTLTNTVLLLKSFANLVAVLNDSKSLIVAYNGALLFSANFRWTFILLNLAILSSSALCLATLVIVPLKPERKLKLLRHYVIIQLIIALGVLILMTGLWFAPFNLELDQESWRTTIASYKYQFEPDSNGLLPDGRPNITDADTIAEMDSGAISYEYSNKVDRLQQALGCCGLWTPSEWQRNQALGLLAPSCCPEPIRFEAGTRPLTSLFYCAFFRSDGDLHTSIGCQRRLDQDGTRFVFKLRLQLLLLLTALLLNILCQGLLKFEPSQVDERTNSQPEVGDRRRRPPAAVGHSLHLPPPPPPYEPPSGSSLVTLNELRLIEAIRSAKRQSQAPKPQRKTGTSNAVFTIN